MKKVLFLTNIPSPYRVEFFNQLGLLVDLTVVFEYEKSNDRNDNWYSRNYENFKAINLNNDSLINIVDKSFDIVFNCDYSTKYGVLLNFICKIRKIKIIIEADGGIPIKRNFLVEFTIRRLMRMFDYCFSSSIYTNDYYNYYGIKDNIIQYHFSSLTIDEIEKHKRIDHSGFNIISVGQMIHRKGFDLLLEATKNLDCNVTIIGGVPDQKLKSINKNAHFIDFVSKEELNKFYANSDLFVLASREEIWGLVLNEAISFELPIISSDNCIAGKEFINNYNCGLIFENENFDDLNKKIKTIISNKKLYNEFVSNCKMVNRDFNIERMVEEHYAFINSIC